MALKFTKMHGLGNDFIVLNAIHQKIHLSAQQIQTLADRHRGIGFDQCLIIEPAQESDIDFNYRIFNSDGHEVGQCGNGVRCLALFAQYYGLTHKRSLNIATKTTRMRVHINTDNSVSVDMGTPNLDPKRIPLLSETQEREYLIELHHGAPPIRVHALSVGNPHAVLLVSDISQAPLAGLGAELSVHPRFPEQVNVGFMQILDTEHLRLRVYERGCGETQACGSGAVAAAAIGRLYHNLASNITVSLPGGDLRIDWPDTQASLVLTGPATFIYEGTLHDDRPDTPF